MDRQAHTLAKSLARRVEGKATLPFHYMDYGSLISLSSGTVGNLMGSVTIEGRIARRSTRSIRARLGWVTLTRAHGAADDPFRRVGSGTGAAVSPVKGTARSCAIS